MVVQIPTKLHTVFCRGKYQWNEAGNFFLLTVSVSKSIGNNNFFIINGFTDGQNITNARFTNEAFLSVISLVN
jgi:hypothetical protein